MVTNVDLLEVAVSADLSRLLDRGAAEAEQGHDEIIEAVGIAIAADQAGRLGDVVLLAHLSRPSAPSERKSRGSAP